MTKRETPRGEAEGTRLVFGLLLIGLGVLMLAGNLGYSMPLGWWRYFPVPLIALGLWGLLFPSRHLERTGGLWLLTTGMYCLIGVFDLFGLGWGGGWPLFVVAAGVGFMLGRPRRGEQAQSRPPEAGGDV